MAGCKGKTDLSTLGNNITCYAAAYNKGIYKSDNGGISWYLLPTDQEDIYLYSKKLFLSPDSKRLYVTTTGGGLFYIDLDKCLLNRVDEFKDNDVRSVAFKKTSSAQNSDPALYVAKKETGIYKASAGITNWKSFNNGLAYWDVNTLNANGGNLYAGTINGIFKWNDASEKWQDISEGIRNKNITSLNADSEGKIIYAGSGTCKDKKGFFQTNPPSLYQSTDGGKTWQASDKGLPDDILVFSTAVNPLKPERIYIGTSEGIFRSTDKGSKWSKTDDGIPDEFKALDIKIANLSDGRVLVYAAGVNGIFMALDEKNPDWIKRSYGLDDTYISSILLAD